MIDDDVRDRDEQQFDAFLWGTDLLMWRSFERFAHGEISHRQYMEETETMRRFMALARAWFEDATRGRR